MQYPFCLLFLWFSCAEHLMNSQWIHRQFSVPEQLKTTTNYFYVSVHVWFLIATAKQPQERQCFQFMRTGVSFVDDWNTKCYQCSSWFRNVYRSSSTCQNTSRKITSKYLLAFCLHSSVLLQKLVYWERQRVSNKKLKSIAVWKKRGIGKSLPWQHWQWRISWIQL